MFYDFHLLRRQNEGRFAMAWAAATRGIANTSREFGLKRIHDLNIILLCGETMEYLQSSSNDPKKRLSLRMSIYLIRGTVLLFNKQVFIFQDELSKFFTKISVPQTISWTRETIPSQRDFEIPPTPVIKTKRKRKKPARAADESLALEEFLRLGREQNTDIEPIDADDRRRRLQLVEQQPELQVGVTDDILGDFGVVPMVVAPEKAPSEKSSEKSMLEKIEELLAAEEEKEKLKEPTPRLKRKRSCSSIPGSPKIIQVEAMVHRSAEEQEKGATSEVIAPEKIEDRMQSEIMEETTLVPAAKTLISEEHKIMEEIQLVENIVEKQPTPVPEKPISTTKVTKVAARRMNDAVSEKSSQESDVERKKKKELIDKYLRIKFKKPKRVLHLDDYDKIFEMKEEFTIDIYNDRILDANLMNKVMRKFTKIDISELVEEARREGVSGSQSSDVHGLVRKLSAFSTPLDAKSISTPQLLTESEKLFPTLEMAHSTPFRTDIPMSHKVLYDESRVVIEGVVPEKHEKITEKFSTEFQEEKMSPQLVGPQEVPQTETEKRDVESCTITEFSIRKSKSSDEQEMRRKTIIEKIKQWDEAQGDLTFNDLIPTPKNRKNAAVTFGDLLVS